MLSAEYHNEINADFARQLALLDDRCRRLEEGLQGLPFPSGRLLSAKKKEIMDTFNRCTGEEAEALAFLYSAMPFSDLVDYPASLFLTYARHGVFLWNKGPFAGRVPERLFANYVLHYRVNNEDITDTRGFFYDKLKSSLGESLGSGSMYDIAIEANYWCAGEATYRSTDGRTQNARTMYGTAAGRCGEESTFAVTVLRSIGIPARQIYAPLWTHCDDNHAWVELWCDGEWHFLGACEPEERMDRGWFIGPASRAVLLHSRWFGKDEPEERQVGPKGMAKVLNHLDRYAHTVELKVKVKDESGETVPGAKLNFQVLNHGVFGNVAVVHAGFEGEDCGVARLMTGFGDLYLSGSSRGKEGYLYGQQMISLVKNHTPEEMECEIILKRAPECFEGWREFAIHAPEPANIHESQLTPEQEKTGERRLASAAEHRQKKTESFYPEREAERVLGRFTGEDRELAEKILRRTHSNSGEIIRFLEWDGNYFLPPAWENGKGESWKLKLLEALREKDCWDIRADVLTDCCINALPYGGSVPDEIFYRYVLCPRVSIEMLRPCRIALEKNLDEKVKADIRENPDILPKLAEKWIISMPEQEYEDLITTPAGCVLGGVGSRLSRDVFCVNLYRSLGIPARISSFDGALEYYRDGKFVKAGEREEEYASLTLQEDGSLKLSDWEHYSLERFEGEGFVRLGLWGVMSEKKENEIVLSLRPGIYRIVTTNRRKNGDQAVRMAMFTLEEKACRTERISLSDADQEDLPGRVTIEDFALRSPEGEEYALSKLAGEGRSLFLWLAVTREPTEHILNELYDKKEEFSALEAPIYVVLKSPGDLENTTLSRTLDALPGIHTVLDDFGENYRSLAKKTGQEPGKLPLCLVLEGGKECIYSDSGYNVGLADILYRILTAHS